MARNRYTIWDDALGYVYFYGSVAALLFCLCALEQPFSPSRVLINWLAGSAFRLCLVVGSYVGCIRLFKAWALNRHKAAALRPDRPLRNSPMGTRAGWLSVILWTIAALCLCLTGFKGPAPGFLAPYTGNLFSTLFFCFPAGWLFWVIWRHESAAFIPATSAPDFADQAPHGRAQFATADDLRAGGFID